MWLLPFKHGCASAQGREGGGGVIEYSFVSAKKNMKEEVNAPSGKVPTTSPTGVLGVLASVFSAHGVAGVCQKKSDEEEEERDGGRRKEEVKL